LAAYGAIAAAPSSVAFSERFRDLALRDDQIHVLPLGDGLAERDLAGQRRAFRHGDFLECDPPFLDRGNFHGRLDALAIEDRSVRAGLHAQHIERVMCLGHMPPLPKAERPRAAVPADFTIPSILSIIEAIVRGLGNWPLRKQVEVARYVHRLNTNAQQERAAVLRRTHGMLDETDGRAFVQTMDDARRLEAHG